MFIIRVAISFLLTVAFLPTIAAGQYSNDAGQYVILSAQYGTERNHVDVTNRLKELAQRDRVFRMGNSTFGVDPDHGSIKALRIYARGADGRERMFEYREGSTVDGSQFRGWDRGDWGQGGWSGRWEGGSDNGGNYNGGNYNDGNYNTGNTGDAGQYVILSAQYGTERSHVDVTNRLKELAQRDRVFRMGNSTFGVDPDHGRIKALRIYARGADARERVFEYREGGTVDGSQFRGWDRGDWGQGGWSGRWEGGSTNGGDYHVGNNGGNYNDGNYNTRDARDAGQYVILSAQYGTKNRHVDVTDRLRELARRDRTFRMNNSTFGVDPDRGRTKVLRIYTRGPNGRERKFEYREGSTVDGSQFSSWGRGEWANERWNGRW